MANTVLNSSLGEGVAFRYCASVFSESGASKQMSLPDKCVLVASEYQRRSRTTIQGSMFRRSNHLSSTA